MTIDNKEFWIFYMENIINSSLYVVPQIRKGIEYDFSLLLVADSLICTVIYLGKSILERKGDEGDVRMTQN